MAYCIAVAAVGAAVLFRWLLDPALGDQLPLVTLYGAIAIALWFGGHRPALLATALGYLACAYLFIPPRFGFAFDVPTFTGLAAYLITCSLIIGFGEAMRRAERHADESREQLRVTVTSIGDAVITTDAEGRVTVLNPIAETLTGWTNADASGQPLHAVFRIVNEVTRQAVESPVAKVMHTGKTVGLANQTVLIAKDGTERPIDDSAAPIRDAKGKITGIVLTFRDVTERRQAEQNRWQLAAIALSGWGQENDRRLSEEAGFDHHMLKPASPDALMEVLESVPAQEGIN